MYNQVYAYTYVEDISVIACWMSQYTFHLEVSGQL
jgi:hypothetical protein